jgi:hypothetical protein
MLDNRDGFMAALEALPLGYTEGLYSGRRYGVTINRSNDGRRWWLFGRELGGTDIVSLNLYRPKSAKIVLRPCEMSIEKVTRFVLGYRPGARRAAPIAGRG